MAGGVGCLAVLGQILQPCGLVLRTLGAVLCQTLGGLALFLLPLLLLALCLLALCLADLVGVHRAPACRHVAITGVTVALRVNQEPAARLTAHHGGALCIIVFIFFVGVAGVVGGLWVVRCHTSGKLAALVLGSLYQFIGQTWAGEVLGAYLVHLQHLAHVAALLVVVVLAVLVRIGGECFKVHEHAAASVALPVATNTEHERASLWRLVAVGLISPRLSNVGGVLCGLVGLLLCGGLHRGAKFRHFHHHAPKLFQVCGAALWSHGATVPAVTDPRLRVAQVCSAAGVVSHYGGQLCHQVGKRFALGALQRGAHHVGEVLGGVAVIVGGSRCAAAVHGL